MRILPAVLVLLLAAAPPNARPGAGATFSAHARSGRPAFGHGSGHLSSFWQNRTIDRGRRAGSPAGYGGWGYAAGYGYSSSVGGFFTDGEVIPAGRGIIYDYDRGYPYDHYREARPPAFGLPPAPRPYLCDVETGVRVCRR
jgi:hypothetical protein